MCTVVVRSAPNDAVPVQILALRDEFVSRSFDLPGMWWDEHPGVIGGRDQRAGGTWCVSHVPSGVTAVVLNVTVTEPSDPGVLTVYPDDPRPLASNLNWSNGQTVPNLVIVPVVNGTVKIFNNSPGTVHVVADLNGYFTH